MGLPNTERKNRLARLFTPKPQHSLLFVQSIPDTGKELFAHAAALELEGIVAASTQAEGADKSRRCSGKRLDSRNTAKRRMCAGRSE
jgi:hypothetical protein